MRKAVVFAAIVLTIVVCGLLISRRDGGSAEDRHTVKVLRGTVKETAIATGRIKPAYEVSVRSLVAGLVGERFVKLGDHVKAGDPLVEVVQETTNQKLLNAQRNIEAAQRAEEAAREYANGEHFASYLTHLMFGQRWTDRMMEEAEIGRRQAEEEQQFIRTGRLRIGEYEIDTIVRAPVAGQVIDLISARGQRVIPVDSYQPTTEIATIADMGRLEFCGTVNEIDVGKLRQGLPAEIRIGALPAASLQSTVLEVGLKAKELNGATVFDVRLAIEGAASETIRAGYSATADICMEHREGVLILPERVIEFRNNNALVRTVAPDGAVREKTITTGLSDGLTVEIISGLSEGETVLEKDYPKIE